MDAPTMEWLRENITEADVAALSVLEVGSLNVNGSIRGHVLQQAPHSYTGLDIEAGPGVDLVASIHDLSQHIPPGSVDVIISTEALEHIRDWRNAINEMKAALKPGGLLILTTRRPGFPLHNYPEDHWRFTPQNLRAAMVDFWVLKVQTVAGCGVVLKARKPYAWEAPASLAHIRPEAAPTRPQSSFRGLVWQKVAYRLQSPAVPNPPASLGTMPCSTTEYHD